MDKPVPDPISSTAVTQKSLFYRLKHALHRTGEFVVNGEDPVFRTYYLGNLPTLYMRGNEDFTHHIMCIYNHFKQSHSEPSEMQLTVTNSGLKAQMGTQTILYQTNRLVYSCTCSTQVKLFTWVYKHDSVVKGKPKNEYRVHSVLCETELQAKQLEALVKDRVKFTFTEYKKSMNKKAKLLKSSSLSSKIKHDLSSSSSSDLHRVPRTHFLDIGNKYKPTENNNLDFTNTKVITVAGGSANKTKPVEMPAICEENVEEEVEVDPLDKLDLLEIEQMKADALQDYIHQLDLLFAEKKKCLDLESCAIEELPERHSPDGAETSTSEKDSEPSTSEQKLDCNAFEDAIKPNEKRISFLLDPPPE